MCTTNGLERLNTELNRRTRVTTLFPNLHRCQRLVSALLAEQDEEWMTKKNLPEHETLTRRYCATTPEPKSKFSE